MGVITKNPEILGGTPVFRGTRVPIQTLFDYLEGGETLEDFLEGFPTVSREFAVAALEEAKHLLLARPYTYSDRRLAGLKNGDLLAAAETAKFGVFLTVDQGFEYQQNLTARKLAIIIFHAKSNRLNLLPLVPACLAHSESVQPGQIVTIED